MADTPREELFRRAAEAEGGKPISAGARVAHTVLAVKSGSLHNTRIEDNPMTGTATVVTCDPEILSGTPVFAGTRVPVQAMIDYLAAGDPLSEFLDDFPSVTREQAVAALRIAGQALVAHARPD